MDKINIDEIRGEYRETNGLYVGGGNDTIKSIKMVAEKINEIIEAQENPELLAEPKVSAKNWRAEEGGMYWYVNHFGEIYGEGDEQHEGDSVDTHRYNTLNYFKTEKQAEAYKEYRLAIATVSRAIWDANGEWEVDWSDGLPVEIYFDTESEEWMAEDLINWCALMALPYCKNKEIALQIIKDYEPELEIIRNYKR
tara:strand:+ start:676 stop:1263 length:588 start_codon:yes stop_codon:yes gene_type:complete